MTLLRHTFHRLPHRAYALMAWATLAVLGLLPTGVQAQGLPQMDDPTRGGGGGLFEKFQNYAYDAGIVFGLLVTTVAFFVVANSAIAKFREASEKGKWGDFAIVIVIGVILVVAVIWLATEAAQIL